MTDCRKSRAASSLPPELTLPRRDTPRLRVPAGSLATAAGQTVLVGSTNNRAVSEVSDRCAFDVRCNAEEAYRISKGGRDWGQWSTWHNGAYREFM